jgi:hypothetical protein
MVGAAAMIRSISSTLVADTHSYKTGLGNAIETRTHENVAHPTIRLILRWLLARVNRRSAFAAIGKAILPYRAAFKA